MKDPLPEIKGGGVTMTDELIGRLETRLQGMLNDDDLAEELLEDAQSMCLGYLNRETLPEACVSPMLRLAAALFNRLGMEGESNHSEGGIASTADMMPEDVKTALRPYRLAKVVR